MTSRKEHPEERKTAEQKKQKGNEDVEVWITAEDSRREKTTSRKRQKEEETTTAEWKKQKVTPLQRCHYGLVNQGATCYLNSVLQVLFVTSEIHGRLDPESQITDEELKNIFESLEEATCQTENIIKTLEIQNVDQQRDAAECLEMILSKISPQASETFQGKLIYTTKCSKDHNINEETNAFWTLPLSLKDDDDETYSVKRGFEKVFHTRSYSGDNMVYCNECKKKTEATSGCEMVEFPQILTLLLKRFDMDYNTMTTVKSDCCVDIPFSIENKNNRYNLYGIVNHIGSLRGGHYTAIVLSKEEKTWYYCDDTYIEKIEEQPFAKNETYKSSTAYLLMYRASESLSDEMKEQGEREEYRKREEFDVDSSQPCKTSSDKKSKPVYIFLIVSVCVVVLILIIVGITLSTR